MNTSAEHFQESLLQHVKTAISRGFHVFPLTPRAKVTVPGSHGFKDSRPPADPSALAPWHQEPSFNIGIDLGASDLCVLDFDDPSGIPAWVNEIRTYKVRTARGIHIYFRGARPTTGLFVDDTKVGDIKSTGGYVLAEGSVHPDGPVYTVIDDSAILPLPDISSLVKRDRERVNASVDGPSIPHGSHDTELFRIACMLRNAGMDYEQICDNLITICEKRCRGYGPDYVDMCEKKAKSACKYPVGKADPRVYIGSSQAATAGASETKSLADVLAPSRYDFSAPVPGRVWDYADLIPRGTLCLWLGARKAEKSLFALRKAMHDACGKNWLNHRNCVGAVRVLYFDAENDKADVDDRFREIIAEFTPGEQELIQRNLVLRIGKEIKRAKVDFEVWNRELFEFLKRDAGDPQVVYLDCWYQLQSIKPVDNEEQKKALEMFEEYFPNTTIFLLHHTGRESQESLVRKTPACLRVIGAERWSNKSAGGNVLTKKAEVILCQEKYVERDDEGIEGDWFIDFQVYARATAGSILYSFEPVFFGEEIDGIAPEYKFRRKMVVKLSSLAAQAARKLQGKGPWLSRYALAKDVGMNGGKQYKAIDELIVKGFITDDGKDAGFSFTDDEDAIELSAENVVALKTAGSFLDDLLLRPDGRPNQGVPYDLIKMRAEGDGISLASLRKARQRKKVRSEERDGKTWWVANAATKWPQLVRAA